MSVPTTECRWLRVKYWNGCLSLLQRINGWTFGGGRGPRDALVLQCDLPSEWPRWSAVGGACALFCVARRVRPGSQCWKRVGTRLPAKPKPPLTCTCWNVAAADGTKYDGSLGHRAGGLRRSCFGPVQKKIGPYAWLVPFYLDIYSTTGQFSNKTNK